MADDDLDELLTLMERRASRLTSRARGRTDSDSFGRVPSMLTPTNAVVKVGDAIGENYEVVEILDVRAGSAVALVRHRFVDRNFTMKILPPALASDADHVSRFKNEARATSMMGHENIVFVTDFGRSAKHGFYYVMEYLDGETLAARLEKAGRLSIQAALEIALCAGNALAAVHDLGIVHRDVTPKNLMSHTGDGEEVWKLLDFGLSSKVVRAHEVLPFYDDPRYVAPEIASGDTITAQADQFSLAAVLYEVLFGTPPWPTRNWTDATPQNWVEPETSDDLIREVGPYLRRVLIQALDPTPERRFADIDQFISSFQRASGRSRRATIPPLDVFDASRALAGFSAAASVEIGTTFDSEANDVPPAIDGTGQDPPSVEISLDILSSLRPKITMKFQTAARLRREWRRNLAGGGLFVPTERKLDIDEEVAVVLRFAPTGEEGTFDGVVAGVVEVDPAGLSVRFESDDLEDIHKFVASLDLGIVSADTMVRPVGQLSNELEVTSDEAFLLSRLTEPMTVGHLRGMFASLPMDLDDVLARLSEKGVVEIGDEARERLISRSGFQTPVSGEPAVREHFIRETLQRADYLRNQGNFLAEIETLRLASERYNLAEFHYRIALSRVQFLNDLAGAREAMAAAVAADPDNEKYRKALDDLQHLAGS